MNEVIGHNFMLGEGVRASQVSSLSAETWQHPKSWSSSSTASLLRSATPHLSPYIDSHSHNHILFSFTTSKVPELPLTTRTLASLRKDPYGQSDQQVKKNSKLKGGGSKPPRQLISISTSEGRWHGEWIEEYALTLRDLRLSDLAQNGLKDSHLVFITLTIHKDTGFGLSVNGRIRTSFNNECWNCSTYYCREIDTNFKVWVLPTSRTNEFELPEIGGEDPSVIYVKPGTEADLDALIRDTIRLAFSVRGTCSESCEKAPSKLYFADIGGKPPASIDKRWFILLELRKSLI